MTYIKVKSMMEKDPDTTREQIMKACKCGEMQATAWMQRYKVEVEGKKRSMFDGRYQGGKKPESVNRTRDKNRKVNTRATGKGSRPTA